jgi:hypothetical protein
MPIKGIPNLLFIIVYIVSYNNIVDSRNMTGVTPALFASTNKMIYQIDLDKEHF